MTTSTTSVSRTPRWLRIAARAAGVGVVLTGIVGVLHMPFAAPFLRKISPAFACPIRHGTPEQIDRAHALASASIRDSASSVAPARPALGFELDKTRRGDVEAWAARSKVSCASIGGNENLQKCQDVPAAAVGESPDLGMLEEVTFEFQASGELVTVQTMRRHLAPAAAAHTVAQLEQSAASALGEPTTVGGVATSAHLGRSFLSSYVAVHTFKDYRATVSATNLAQTGVMVREEYLSAR
jgi:hypothetical protein